MVTPVARWIGLLGALLVAGGTSMETGDRVWFRPGGTIEGRDRLLVAAQVQAMQAMQAQAAPKPGSPDLGDARRQTERQATLATMTAAGWNLVPKAQAGPLDREKGKAAPQPSLVAPTALDR